MKQSTSFAQVATNLLNVLQGYTKGIRMTAILILLLMGVSNAWAYNVKSPHVYFNATNVSSWPGVNIVVGHDSYSFGDLMSKVSNTNLYYAKVTFNGTDANGFVFIGANSKWGEWKNQSLYDRTIKQSDRTDYLWFHNTITGGLPSGTYYFSTSGNKQAIDYSQYTTIPTFNTTSAVRVRTGTSGTYSNASGTYPANISIQGTYISGDGKTNRTSITSTKSSDGDGEKVYGSVITGLVTLSYSNLNEAYTFDGWGTSNSEVSSTSTNYEFNQSANTTVYAFFTKKTYTITYKQGANGSGSIDAGTKEHGVDYTLSSNKFTRTGYTQTGWSTSDGGAKVYDLGGTYTANTNVTLYPFWTPNQYTITLNANGGASNGSATATYNSSTITNLTHPTYIDYRCNGYFTTATDGTLVLNTDGTLAKNVSGYTDANGNWIKDDNATLYAQWTYDVTEYTVTFGVGTASTSYGSLTAKNNSTSAAITSPATVRSGQNITFTATPKTGYEVEGWYTNDACTTGKHNDGNTTYTTTITAATNVYVKFVEKTWSVAFAASTGGAVSPAEEQTVGVITGVNITATPQTGYTFAGWTSSAGGEFGDVTATVTTFKPTAATTITASFEEIKHNIQVGVAAEHETWGSVSTNSVSVGQHTTSSNITATAKTSLGYVFDHWEISDGITITSGDANSATIKIKATKAGSLTAHFRGENRLQNVYLIGTMNNWKTSDADWRFYKLPGESGNTVTLTKTIDKSDYHEAGYKFGINIYHSDWGSKYWKNSSEGAYKMDAHNCTSGWGFNTDGGDFNTFIDLNVSGEYTFTLTDANASDKQKLSITYPDKSFIEGAFEHAWDEEAYPLVENGDIQEVTIHIASKNDVEFRLVSHGKLWGTTEQNLIASNTQTLSPKNMEDKGAVMKIGAYLEGDYTFSYNKSTKVLTVTYPVVNQLQVYRSEPAHAEVINNWNWDNQDGNVYTKALLLNANTTYEFKCVVNSDFFGKNSTTLTRQSSSTTLSTSGGDVKITTDVAGNYIFTYNSESKQLSITYPEAYTVTYGVGDNKGAESVTTDPNIASGSYVLPSTSITFSKSATKEGYTWKGWYSQADGKGTLLSAADQDYISPALAANLNVYACYDLIPYNIEYNLKGGAGAENTTYNVTSSTITLPTPVRTGYTFVGWYVESDFSGEAVQTIPQGSTGDKTFYANWTPTEYTITYQSNGGTGAENTTYTIESEDIILPTEMLRTGYTFVGWYAKSDFSGDVVIILETGSYGNKTFYAKWNPITYTITYKDQGAVDFSGSNTASLPTKHTYGAQTILVAGEREGYIFRGWYIDQECGGTALTQLAATAYADHITLYAKWECTPPTSVSVSGTYHFFPSEAITLIATPEGGSPDCTYQWQKFEGSNWKDIDGATSNVYTKAEATVADAGEYRCVVTAGGSCVKESDLYKVKCLQLYLYMSDNSDKENLPLSKVDGTKATATVNLENSDYTYHFKVTDGCGNWYGNSGTMTAENRTNWPMDCDAYCGLYSNRKGQYKFTIDYTDLAQLKVSVTYPSANQEAGKVIYWDNSVLKWEKVYYRIGHTNHTTAVEMQKVPGTTNLYQVKTSAYDGFEVWHIANNAGWTGEGNTIYKTNTNDAYTITDAMAFEPNVVTEDQTVVPTNNPATGNTAQNNNCQFYPYERPVGIKSHMATINAATNGTIQVAYTDVNGNAQTFTEGTQNLAHTCLLTITAEPKTGYSLQSLTVNGEAFTSGNTYTLTSDATIEAAWVPVTYTITYDNLDGATANNPSEYTIESNITLNEPTNAPEGYTFVGWYENADYTGNKVTNINGATGNKTLYAKWAYTVQWSVNGEIVKTETVAYGATASAPDIAPPYPCDADVFAGWITEELEINDTDRPDELDTSSSSPTITEDTTFYAVFADYEN